VFSSTTYSNSVVVTRALSFGNYEYSVYTKLKYLNITQISKNSSTQMNYSTLMRKIMNT